MARERELRIEFREKTEIYNVVETKEGVKRQEWVMAAMLPSGQMR